MRIIVDTQSNRLFRGIEMEQNYDQRGGLCQAGEGDVIITTNPINDEYLFYWENLGFDVPVLLTAGPFDPKATLSELILGNAQVQEELEKLSAGKDARLEFFTIEETERLLAEKICITPYCNFEISSALSLKHNFKDLCGEIGLQTPAWMTCIKMEELLDLGREFLKKNGAFLIKSSDGTGGISCGGMAKVENEDDLIAAVKNAKSFGSTAILEKIIRNVCSEVSIHWEITKKKDLKILGIFNQLSKNFTYDGVCYPANGAGSNIQKQLVDSFAPALIEKGALGFYCCDVIVDENGEANWIDFNPRKGAIVYIYSMVKRIADMYFDGKMPYFYHRHNYSEKIVGKDAFLKAKSKLSDLLIPGERPFVVLTNPGVMDFGYFDITGISQNSAEEAESVFREASKRL